MFCLFLLLSLALLCLFYSYKSPSIHYSASRLSTSYYCILFVLVLLLHQIAIASVVRTTTNHNPAPKPQPLELSLKPRNPKPRALNRQPEALNPKSCTLNLKPAALNTKTMTDVDWDVGVFLYQLWVQVGVLTSRFGRLRLTV